MHPGTLTAAPAANDASVPKRRKEEEGPNPNISRLTPSPQTETSALSARPPARPSARPPARPDRSRVAGRFGLLTLLEGFFDEEESEAVLGMGCILLEFGEFLQLEHV